MLQKGFLKPELSVSNIGKWSFWLGISLGLYVSLVLNLLFGFSRESFRVITFLNDPLILTPEEFQAYDLFFALFSTSLGFGVTIIYWLIGRKNIIRKKYLKIFSISNTAFICIAAFAIVARFGSKLAIVPYGLRGYDNELNLLQDHKLLLILIPIYIFLANWMSIRLIFKTQSWIILSFLVCLIISLILFQTTSVDKEILNNAYYRKYAERFDFIDKEFEKATKYEVYFPDSIKQILQKMDAARTLDLVLGLKKYFESNAMVPKDILILEKISVHNLNKHMSYWIGNKKERDKNWPYAMPEDIYRQIIMHHVGEIEMQLLFEILYEQISLLVTEKPDYNKFSSYSRYQKEKWYYKDHLINRTTTILSRLVQVAEKLRTDNKYVKYHSLIPEIEFDDYDGQQTFHELDFKQLEL